MLRLDPAAVPILEICASGELVITGLSSDFRSLGRVSMVRTVLSLSYPS